MKEIKMSGILTSRVEDDNRAIYMDSGGIVWIRDYTLNNCGGYKEGDKICITITSCAKDEYYYPPKPKDTILSTSPSSAPTDK